MFCGKCGHSVPAEAQYCGHCGAPFVRAPGEEPSPAFPPVRVTKRKSTSWHWPKIVDANSARDAALEGVGVSLFVSAVTGVTAILSILSRKPVLGLDGWALLDAALFALAGWRIYRMSRVWAVLGLLLYLAEMTTRILQYFESSTRSSIPPFSFVAAIFTLGFVNAVRGTFAFRRFREQAANISGVWSSVASAKSPQDEQLAHGLPQEPLTTAGLIPPPTVKYGVLGRWKKLAVISFCAAAGLVVAVALLAAGINLYRRRSAPTKDWPVIDIRSQGIRASLSTELLSGSVLYRLLVEPVSSEFSLDFDKEAVSDSAKEFTVILRDAGDFELCTEVVAALAPAIDDSGRATALRGEGALTYCSPDKYLQAAHADLKFKFPRLRFQPTEAEKAAVRHLIGDGHLDTLSPEEQRAKLQEATGDPEFPALDDGDTFEFLFCMQNSECSESSFPNSNINRLAVRYGAVLHPAMDYSAGIVRRQSAPTKPLQKRAEPRPFKEESRISSFDPFENTMVTDSGAKLSIPKASHIRASQWAHSGNSEYNCPIRISCDDKGDCTIENRWNGQTISATLLKRPSASE